MAEFEYEPIACTGDENVSTAGFNWEDVSETLAQFEDSVQWEYYNTYTVVQLNDGRYVYMGEYQWGTCEICGGDDQEYIVSDDLETLYKFGLTDEARAFLHNELKEHLG